MSPAGDPNAIPGKPDDPMPREGSLPTGRYALGREAFVISNGMQSQDYAYAGVSSARLSFRPRSIDYRVFRLDIAMRDGRTLSLENVSPSPLQIFSGRRRDDAGFSAFARALLARLAMTSPKARFEAGMPAWRFWPATLVGMAFVAFLAVRLAQYAMIGQAVATLLLSVALAVSLAFLLSFLWRNRPRPLDPRNPPPELLP